MRRLPRHLLAVAALAAVVITVPAPAAAHHRAASCRNADLDPIQASLRTTRSATLCLVNAERRHRGLRPLRHEGRLARAAARHARDMVRRRYFSHVSLSGRSFTERILRTGYGRRGGRWLLGENLGWGAGKRATPRAIVRAWMRSPTHRANVLRRDFRDVGIATVRAVPVQGSARGATYAAEFGRLR